MSGRRAVNRNIRGPQSALTDFLAANDISAAQINDSYRRRLREAEQQHDSTAEASSSTATRASRTQVELDREAAEAFAAAEEAVANNKKRKRVQEEAIDKIKSAKSKKAGKKKAAAKKAKKDAGSDDDDEYDDVMNMYKKVRKLPGQLENCEICDKRFTVTPYSKEGPDGGLLCTPCGKQQTKDAKSEQRAKKKPAGRKRRQAESNRLDGNVANRVKSLQQLCIETVVKHHEDVEELGDMPAPLLDQVSAIFSKRRVMNTKTLPLFVRPDLECIPIHDAAALETNDYVQMFQVAPSVSKLVLRNCGQLKDDAAEYMLDKCDNITYLQLYAANLISNDMWRKVFSRYGGQLDTLKLMWLDATFDDDVAADMVRLCPHINRLKLKLCRLIGDETVQALSNMHRLEHLSLQIGRAVPAATLEALVATVGPGLRTLSLEQFYDLDDSVLAAIHDNCSNLKKLRVSDNDLITDAGLASLFTDWRNGSLRSVDFSSTRDLDNNNPNGPMDPVGLADEGFAALMEHSGGALEHLNIASCRHISLGTFNNTFDGKHIYPSLEYIDLSFCSCVDTRVIAGIFKSCPAIKKVIAFGCFDVMGVTVPRGVVLIGVPKAQDEIEQIGIGVGVEEAVGRMIEAAA